MSEQAVETERRGFRFSPEINLGHLLIFAGMLGSSAVIYADVKSTIALHEFRITALESSNVIRDKARDERDREIRDKLETIVSALAKHGIQ